MRFKGVFSSGVVILDDSTGLREGQAVRVEPAKRRPKATPRAGTKEATARPRGVKKKAAKRRRVFGAGLWEGRTDLGATTEAIAKTLRLRALGGRRGA